MYSEKTMKQQDEVLKTWHQTETKHKKMNF